MIVVDTNVIAYLYLPTDYTRLAEQLLAKEPDWAAPLLWRSELRNVLALYLRKNLLSSLISVNRWTSEMGGASSLSKSISCIPR